ncbi:MAG TPA: hypothetical protein VFG04_08700 [Planctomycetaceae bacterium]|jgi:hypothetical protein|nr:hypothetical protein [Planctomycetaceae bacterium]
MQALVRVIGRYCLTFILFYWICFTFPFPLELVGLPFQFVKTENQPAWMKAAGEKYGEAYSWITDKENAACTSVGNRVLDVEAIIQPTGSGDTMRAYIGCLCAIVIAAVAALLWTAIVPLVQKWKPDSRPERFLHEFVRILVRFFLCEMLLGYGFAKVFPLQFPEASSVRLEQQLGEMSPMGLLWTFMGHSPKYQMFTGAVEVLAGLLLTVRRTTLLGALVTSVSMTHVFALNMCFDVPVKLYSFNYLLMSIFLVAPELPRLIRVLVLGKAVEARPFTPLFGHVPLERLAHVLRTLLVVAMVYGQIHGSLELWNDMYGSLPAPVLGRWDIVSMQVDQKKPGKDDPLNWSWLDFSNRKVLRVAGPKPRNAYYLLTWDPTEKKITLADFRKPEWTATFNYDLPQPDKLKLQGSMDGKAINATLKRTPAKQYELTTRGFHWIQELPYNR